MKGVIEIWVMNEKLGHKTQKKRISSHVRSACDEASVK